MTVPDSDTQPRQHLLAVVNRYRDEKCVALLEQADQQARQLVRQAYREARSRGQRGIADVRLHYRHRIAAAQARLQTGIRQQRQHDNSLLLAGLWEPLRAAILSRWQQPEARREWIDALVQKAEASLRERVWVIEHPAEWPQQEQTALGSRLDEMSLSFTPRTDMTAGLRICAGGACVDGSLEGLLRDRTRIESLLLARLNDCCARQPGDGAAP